MESREIILTIVAAMFASTGFWAFITHLIDNTKARKSSERRALLGLLHDRIYSLANYYISEGQISTADYDNFLFLYEPYAELHGNGTGKKLKEAVDKLKIVN